MANGRRAIRICASGMSQAEVYAVLKKAGRAMTAKEISAILGVDTMTSQDQCRRMFKQGCVERIETGQHRLYAYKLNGRH